MCSTTILLINENEIEAARLLTLGIRYRVFWRQLDRQVLPLVIVVDPCGNVANCFMVIGILERPQYQRGGMSLQAQRARHIR